MMKPFFKSVMTIAGIVFSILIIIWLIRLWIGNSKFKQKESVYHAKIDSLKTENDQAYFIIDSLETVLYNDSIANAKALNINSNQFKYYKRKIKEYEKAINAVSGMSDAALLDSITRYYNRRLGYGR